jgi:hypothetical protein
MPENPSITLPGTVDKIIPATSAREAETVQIHVEAADELFREVRIKNTLTTESGDKIKLKLGSPVDVTITAEAGSTTVETLLPVSNKP